MIRKKYSMRMPAVAAVAVLLLPAAGCGDKKQVQNVQSYRQIGLNQMDQGDYESAVNAFDKALGERVGIVSNLEIDINLYKAYAQIEAGRTKEAVNTYTALVDYDEKNADVYYLRGCAYMSMGETKPAAEDFKQAVKYNKDSGELYASIYEQLTQAGLLDEAAGYLDQGLKMIKGDGIEACVSRGRLYLAGGGYASAETEFKSALDQIEEEKKKDKKKDGKDDGMAVNLYLGEAVRAQGREEEAGEYFEAYAQENPNDTKVLYELGRIAFEDGSYHQALAYFEQGLSCEGIINKRELWTGKIAALEYIGDFDVAKQAMEEYLESYPEDAQAKREYIFLKTR
ncbi:MAG: tetratricopeptide repeat protein [Eubacterium sp.]|nr:tetratricopeptide repeat protein [Eubacterium sp.]